MAGSRKICAGDAGADLGLIKASRGTSFKPSISSAGGVGG